MHNIQYIGKPQFKMCLFCQKTFQNHPQTWIQCHFAKLTEPPRVPGVPAAHCDVPCRVSPFIFAGGTKSIFPDCPSLQSSNPKHSKSQVLWYCAKSSKSSGQGAINLSRWASRAIRLSICRVQIIRDAVNGWLKLKRWVYSTAPSSITFDPQAPQGYLWS